MRAGHGYAASHYAELCEIVADGVGPLLARSVCNAALKRCGLTELVLERNGITPRLVDVLVQGTSWLCKDKKKKQVVTARLKALGGAATTHALAPQQPSVIPITDESHIVDARSSVRRISKAVGFGHTDQIKIATAVSELARNIYKYAGKGTITITATTGTPRPAIRIVAQDEGPGIANLDQVLAGHYRSKTGLGLGIVGCRNLMDEFQIAAPVGSGTLVTMTKYL